MSLLLLNDGHRYYRLHLPGDQPVDRAFKPLEFDDLHFATAFVRGLCRGISRMEGYEWIRILYDVDQKPRNVYNDNVYKIVAELIMRGRIKVYPITHLSQQGHAMGYPIIPADEGKQYRFIPASMLLINELRDVRIFRDHGTAEKFVQSLNLTDAHLEAIIQIHAKPTNDGSARSSVRMTTMLIELLAKGEVVVEKKIIAAAPPKPLEVESASGPGNRPATLGPHVVGGDKGQLLPESRKVSATTRDEIKAEPHDKPSPENISARKKLAHDFYKEQGMLEHKIEAHIEGIDFTKPVERITLKKGSIVEQHQIPNATQGNYYAQVGTDARQLGISKEVLDGKTGKLVERQPKKYILDKDTEVLSSSTRAIDDTWSIPGTNIKTAGGGTQYFTMKRSNFKPG